MGTTPARPAAPDGACTREWDRSSNWDWARLANSGDGIAGNGRRLFARAPSCGKTSASDHAVALRRRSCVCAVALLFVPPTAGNGVDDSADSCWTPGDRPCPGWRADMRSGTNAPLGAAVRAACSAPHDEVATSQDTAAVAWTRALRRD